MKVRELIEKLGSQDPTAEALLIVDIQGMLEYRPVGEVRSATLIEESDTYQGVVLDPDYAIDEARAIKNEEDRLARRRAALAELQDDILDDILGD